MPPKRPFIRELSTLRLGSVDPFSVPTYPLRSPIHTGSPKVWYTQIFAWSSFRHSRS